MRRVYYRYSLSKGAQAYPTHSWIAVRTIPKSIAIIVLAVLVAVLGIRSPLGNLRPASQHVTPVPGQNYNICDLQSQYLTSPWTYHALATGSQSYTVAQYQALSGYGTTLPPLPSYIANQASATEAAVIYAPGSTVGDPPYDYPESPIIHFYEGGAYDNLAQNTISGDEFIGGSAPGFPEPQFDNHNGAGGINGQNGSHYFSGGDSTLTATANAGATSVTVAGSIPGYINYITFADGSTYQIASEVGTTITLDNPLAATQNSGSPVWANQDYPLAYVSTGASQGGTSLTLTSSTVPLVQYGQIHVGSDQYEITSVSGSQSGYTVTVAGLDSAVPAHTPIYYSDNSGDVTVSYLDIAHDSHNTTGTIYTGTGWTITHNNIHDGYKDSGGTPTNGLGVALYGGDEGTFEYNCLDKMGDYGVNIFGSNNKFDYNEVRDSNYLPDPGCGWSGGGKWWGTLNADIVDNAWVDDSPGGGVPIWLDNGNSGTNISGNFFDKSYGSAVHSETGFNLNVSNNLFLDDGWGDGTGGCGDNCIGSVNINHSGGFDVHNSRYENQVAITGNQFINDWSGVSIWQAGGRTCEDSGEGWPADAGYCSGGFPNNSTTTDGGGYYYFSHVSDLVHGFTTHVTQSANSGSSTVQVAGSLAKNDQIDFVNPATASTTDTTSVTTFAGSGTITVNATSGFPSSGQLLVNTSTGYAVLSYTGTTATSFTGVRYFHDDDQTNNTNGGSGTLAGPIQVNDPAFATTTDTTDVTTFHGAGTINASTTGFPTSGQLRVGTSAAWGDGNGSWTGAILSYSGKTASSFTGVSIVRGTGTLSGPLRQIQTYTVTGETCYANDCSVNISPALSSAVSAGQTVNNAGTCQLFAVSSSLPTGPNAPNGMSYWDGCQWESRDVTVTGNNFVLQPSQINADTAINGGAVQCTAANNCGVNFMADQYNSGEAPFVTQIGVNAMLSQTGLTGCPTWSPGCPSNPLANLNGIASPPGAPAGNGEATYNNVWSANTYAGPFSWNTYIFGNCGGGGVFMPSGLTPSACFVNFPNWQSDWEQDQGSTYSPVAVTISNVTDNQSIHGASQSVTAYEDTVQGSTISSSNLQVGTTTDSTITPPSSTPHTFSLNTLNYHDGSYNIKVNATDSSSKTGNDTVPVIIDNGDLNGDKTVNISDLAILAGHWGQTDPNYGDGNITGQSTINISDLAVLASNWGYSH